MDFWYKNNSRIQPSILLSTYGDVTGDRIYDRICLTGIKQADSPFVEDITLIVQNGKNGKITKVTPKENAGYNPSIFLGDFTGDNINDILLQIDSGGSGAITYDYIYSFINNEVKVLFDFNSYNNDFQYKIVYKDNYQVEAISEKNNNKYIINISYKDSEYLDEIYEHNGKLKKPIEGFVNPLSSLFPVDVERNGVYELMAFQKIAGRYNADTLGYFQNFLEWDKKEFILFNQYLGILGAELYI